MTFAQVAAVSYGAAALAFALLTALLLTAWKGRLQGGLLVAATGISALWAGLSAVHALRGVPPASAVALLEILRDGAWYCFLFSLLGYAREERGASTRRADLRLFAVLVLAASAGLAALIVLEHLGAVEALRGKSARSLPIFGHLLLAVAGLALIELLYRNTRPEHRWAIKLLCFGLGGMFAYDLYLYANGLLFRHIDEASWAARGVVNAMVVPMLAVAARRNPDWSLDVFVSRHVVFHSAALLGTGLYLIVMAAAGYYIRLFGGTWGGVAQIAFLFGAVLLLAVLMVSGQARSRLRVFLAKHFYRNRYDYREEWLRFTHTLSASAGGEALKEDIAAAIARIVESPAAVLWARGPGGGLRAEAAWQAVPPEASELAAEAPLVRFLERRGWVVFLDEVAEHPERYGGLELPAWLERMRHPWVIVPLLHGERLAGLVVLARSPTKPALNWEDADLLKTVGRQAASYLALLEANEALAEARQFEAFNRLSAYVVHDLKNLVAQLSLVGSNARRHMHSPGFIEDAMATVEHATAKMNRLLAQLRKGRAAGAAAEAVDLGEVAGEALRAAGGRRPEPRLRLEAGRLRVRAERDRLAAVIGHLVRNAQEATAAEGTVEVRVARGGDGMALLEVADSGCGMDQRFIRERLFRPFDTTKGNAGMGVGVYETREFVTACGGRLEVESEPGRGTVFRMRLPLAGDTIGGGERVEEATG